MLRSSVQGVWGGRASGEIWGDKQPGILTWEPALALPRQGWGVAGLGFCPTTYAAGPAAFAPPAAGRKCRLSAPTPHRPHQDLPFRRGPGRSVCTFPESPAPFAQTRSSSVAGVIHLLSARLFGTYCVPGSPRWYQRNTENKTEKAPTLPLGARKPVGSPMGYKELQGRWITKPSSGWRLPLSGTVRANPTERGETHLCSSSCSNVVPILLNLRVFFELGFFFFSIEVKSTSHAGNRLKGASQLHLEFARCCAASVPPVSKCFHGPRNPPRLPLLHSWSSNLHPFLLLPPLSVYGSAYSGYCT